MELSNNQLDNELKDQSLFQLSMLSDDETLLLKISKIELGSNRLVVDITKALGNNYLLVNAKSPLSVLLGLDDNYDENWRDSCEPLPNSLFANIKATFAFYNYENKNLSFINTLQKYIDFRINLLK